MMIAKLAIINDNNKVTCRRQGTTRVKRLIRISTNFTLCAAMNTAPSLQFSTA